MSIYAIKPLLWRLNLRLHQKESKRFLSSSSPILYTVCVFKWTYLSSNVLFKFSDITGNGRTKLWIWKVGVYYHFQTLLPIKYQQAMDISDSSNALAYISSAGKSSFQSVVIVILSLAVIFSPGHGLTSDTTIMFSGPLSKILYVTALR